VRDLVVLDLRPASAFTDFFVIATTANPRQAKAVYDAVYAGMKEQGLTPRSSDGLQQGTWVIVDYLDVVLHIFSPEAREFYRLEDLWGDVPQLELEAAAG
jgi:ribosome-associated protein